MRLTLRTVFATCLALVGGMQAFGQQANFDRAPDYRRVSVNRYLNDEAPEVPEGVPPAAAPAMNAPSPAYDAGACNTCGPCGAGGGGFIAAGGYAEPCGWFERFRVYGEFLYVRPRNAEVAYGVLANSVNGPVPGSPLTEVGRVGVVDIDYTPAFRAGFTYILDSNNSISAQYTRFEGDDFDRITGNANLNRVATSLVFDPAIQSASNQTNLQGDADLLIRYEMIDLDYRNLLYCDDTTEVALLIGARYGKLRQQFAADFSFNGVGYAATEIDFEGIGSRLGLELEKRLGANNQFFVTGKTYFGMLAGQFNADYVAGNFFDDLEVDTKWKAGRLVSQLDLELAVGWRSVNDTVRVSAGYMFNSWYNVVKTQEFINAVQASNFVDPSTNFNGYMSFDGLTGRVEFRF